MQYPYIVVDNSNDKIDETLQQLERFSEFYCTGVALDSEKALNEILEKKPEIVFLGVYEASQKNGISLALVSQLNKYLDKLPYFIVVADSQKYAYDCIKAGVFDYLVRPFQNIDLIKCLLRVQKQKKDGLSIVTAAPTASVKADNNQEDTAPAEDNRRICIKSYGDYQFISLNEVMYLKADNNTTDFYMKSGRKLTAYKTLKHYENNLPPNFFRIHNSYIVNSDFITRISTGKSMCFLNGNEISVSFSKTYKENIDILIRSISTEYL